MAFEYMRRFRVTRNKCYGLIIGEKDLAELAFVGLSTTLRDKMEGQDFSDVNQVLQQALAHENHAKDHNYITQLIQRGRHYRQTQCELGRRRRRQ
jgi:hypothetical protein